MIEVRVKEGHMVFYGTQRRREGSTFFIKDMSEFSERAMELIEERKKPGPKPKIKE